VFRKIILIALVLMLVPATIYLLNLPDVSQLKKVNPPTSAIRIYREHKARKKGIKPQSVMIWRPLGRISPDLIQAVIQSEDDTFYQHNGFDLPQIRNAFVANWKRKRFAFGGSTITQQLARTLYLSSHKNLLRKAKEALIARQLEKELSKRRILELYLNVVEWGPQVYGAEAAAQHFFNKPASDLTLDEAVALAVILPSPRKWNPLSDSKFMTRRRTELIERLLRQETNDVR
jgi:monofunctional biosynthetic peptidoglycan transglycosylase